MGELSSLQGLGPKSEKFLHMIGIDSIEQLRQLGAVRAFIRVRDETDTRPSLNLLYALAGALDRFSKELNFSGGDLEEKYEKLNDEYEASEEAAENVRERIAKVEDVAEALFEEWQEEITQYSNPQLRRSSEAKLKETRSNYSRLIKSMKNAEAKMAPVLSAFKDQVLFLKHNLNARAIASLQGELVSIESNVAKLIKDMEASIKEANRFIATISDE